MSDDPLRSRPSWQDEFGRSPDPRRRGEYLIAVAEAATELGAYDRVALRAIAAQIKLEDLIALRRIIARANID